jgi:energy-coupling factor transporter ATP-binding protein EcfA2
MISRVKVKNFGPIKDGSLENEGWIELKKVTLFIGNQGSGKSTIAKLISTLTWIEKALVRGDFSEKNLTDKIFKKHFAYQNIGDYFKDNTIIEYEGKAFQISFKNNIIKIKKNEKNGYSFPKIMYVPSERNFVCSVRNVRTLKGLPSTLYTFSDEFINAVEGLKGQIDLPINNTKFEYQKLNKLSSVIGEDYKIKLSEASSGFQSFVPLFVVSDFLANSLEKKEDNTIKDISIEEEKRIRKEIEQILSNPNISDDVKQASLEYLSSKFKYSSFINIVEEPEQNLFPNSQNKILNSLLKFNNLNKNNGLIITTHSPYIINYLCVSIQAHYLFEKLMNHSNQKPAVFLARLNEIVPHKSMVSSSNVIIYQLDEITGTLRKLADYEGIPSDNNYLNKSLADANEMFDLLLEIEQEL